MTDEQRAAMNRTIVRIGESAEWQAVVTWLTGEYEQRIEALTSMGLSEIEMRYVAGQASAVKAVLDLPASAAQWLKLRQEATNG